MEQRLNRITSATIELQKSLTKLQQLKPDAKALFSYYGSEDWYKDRETHSASVDTETTIPKAGVLSEDLVYDSITELRDAAFTMLELGTEVLKDWI